MDGGRVCGLTRHDADEGDDVQIGGGAGRAPVVAPEAAAARRPGEAALGHPAPRREHEAALGVGEQRA